MSILRKLKQLLVKPSKPCKYHAITGECVSREEAEYEAGSMYA